MRCILQLNAPCTYIFFHRKKEQHAVILLFPSSWQQLLPWARSSLCLRYRYMCCRYSIHQNICPLHLYFLLSQERTTHCYFAVFLKLPTAAPRGKIKFMFGISICFVSFVCNNHFILKPYLPCTYIFCHNKIAVILLFFSSLQELLPGARSNVSVLN